MIIEENNLPDVRGLAKVRVETEAEALRWFFEGEKSRTYGHHFLNPVRTGHFQACLATFNNSDLMNSSGLFLRMFFLRKMTLSIDILT